MLPTATEITHFLELFQCRQISKAAIRLGVTQPTLSQSLQKLEEKTGAPLFFRSKQGIVPTREGELFYIHAGKLIESWREVREKIGSTRTEMRGRFRLGCHPSVGLYMLPRFLKKIQNSAPAIQIELVHDSSRKITEQIISYQIEMGFVVNPFRHPDLTLKKLGEDRMEFWQSERSAGIPQNIFADPNLKQVEDLLTKTAREFKNWNLIPTSSLELVRELTSQALGVGILPARIAQPKENKLTLYQKNFPHFRDEIYLAYRREALSSLAGRELIRVASEPLD